MRDHSYHANVLQEEFARRQSKNPRHSLRAFAKCVGIHPSSLSRILSGKEQLSPKAALCISSRLKLTAVKKRLFLLSVIEHRKLNEQQKIGLASGIPDLRPQMPVVNTQDCAIALNLDAHRILQLTLTEDFESTSAFIAKRLKLEVGKVEEILNALERLKMIRLENGNIINAQADFTVIKNDKTDQMRKQLQMDVLTRAAKSIVEDKFEDRANYSLTTAIDPEKLPKAREMVVQFMESLMDFLEQGQRKEVYQLSINLFPLSGKIEESTSDS